MKHPTSVRTIEKWLWACAVAVFVFTMLYLWIATARFPGQVEAEFDARFNHEMLGASLALLDFQSGNARLLGLIVTEQPGNSEEEGNANSPLPVALLDTPYAKPQNDRMKLFFESFVRSYNAQMLALDKDK